MKALIKSTLLAAALSLGFTAYGNVIGSSSGVFTDPVAGSNAYPHVTGVGSNHFTWGTGSPSELKFTGSSFSSPLETYFKVGTLDYYNGVINSDSGVDAVSLDISINFSDPFGLNKSFDYSLQLINTSNVGSQWNQADYVKILNAFPTSTFSLDGYNYTLQLAFGTTGECGFTTISEFHVLEGQTARGQLLGKLTKDIPTPSVPDSSATLALLGLSSIGLLTLRRFVARR